MKQHTVYSKCASLHTILGWSAMALATSLATTSVHALPLALSHLELNTNLQPNVLLVVDDSGSIDFETMVANQWHPASYLQADQVRRFGGDGQYNGFPLTGRCGAEHAFIYNWTNPDNIYKPNDCERQALYDHPETVRQDWRLLSFEFNYLYYNPQTVYRPWPGYENADFSRARSHPDPSQAGYANVRDLGKAGFKWALWRDSAGFTGPTPTLDNATQAANGVVDLWDNFDLYEIGSAAASKTSVSQAPTQSADCQPQTEGATAWLTCFNGEATQAGWDSPFGRTLAQEQQNIANWYQYHRRRSFSLNYMIALLTQRFPTYRYGLDFVNNYNNVFVPMPALTENLPAHNAGLLTSLFEYKNRSAGTPLAGALDRAGQYFQGKRRGQRSPIVQSCQANYALLLTDGFWNDQRTYKGQAKGDLDGDNVSAGKLNTTLADIATYYYLQDLAPNLVNDVTIEQARCQSVTKVNHQHMSTIGVSFGPAGNLTPDSNNCWPEPTKRSDESWGNPLLNSIASNLARVDDLWHAAFNSAGYFISSQNSSSLLAELSEIFGAISQTSTTGSIGSLAGGRVDRDNYFFMSRFDLTNRSGDLLAFTIDGETGRLSDSPAWSASNVRANTNNRQILSFNSQTQRGVRLTGDTAGAALLADTQRQRLFPSEQGPAQLEQTAQWLARLTAAPLGPLVHSNPTFVGDPARLKINQSAPGAAEYAEFRQQTKRRAMVYVGGNDGLLHGFDAQTGEELMSYLPSAILDENLPLTTTGYISRVDGPIVVEDAYIPERGGWRTILVAGFRYGGTGYFALDVTDPEQLTGPNAAEAVLWEFSTSGVVQLDSAQVGQDLGFSYNRAALGAMHNGRWAAVFGNGYNSESGEASLFILDLQSGKVINRLNTGITADQDPLNLNRDNGMSEPSLVDLDQDGVVDTIYAGDYFGNLFAFDVIDPQPNQWRSRYRNAQRAIPLYASGGAALTSRPAVLRHPTGGVMVIVGTGQDIAPLAQAPANALIGVIDNGEPISSDRQLQLNELSRTGLNWQLTPSSTEPNQPLKGWRIPLTGDAVGLMNLRHPTLQFGELTFVLTQAQQQVCGTSDKSSTVLTFDPYTGTSLGREIFLDQDFKAIVNENDSDDTNSIVGITLPGATLIDVTIAGNGDFEQIIGNTSDGQIRQINKTQAPSARGRQRWRRL